MKALYVQYADPALYPPVERSADILSNAGYQVSFLGVEATGQSAGVVNADTSRSNVELLEHKPGGINALRSYLKFWWRTISNVRRDKPDVMYCSDLLSYPAGWIASFFMRGKIVMHEHDPPAESQTWLQVVLKWFRIRLARRASIVVVPQAQRAEQFEREVGVEPLVVFNCPSLMEIKKNRPTEIDRDEVVLWHHGSLGPKRLPLALLDAMALLPSSICLEFAGYETESSVGFVDEFMSKARQLSVHDRVRFIGPLPRDILFERARNAHIGVVMFARGFPIYMAGASVKPFDYLACSLPLLINDELDWVEMFQKQGVARSCNPSDPQSIATAITALVKDTKLDKTMIDAGLSKLLSDWNYEAQFAKVMQRL